jgi:SAM-dependent methyltransferase
MAVIDPVREEAELHEYLGDAFDRRRLMVHEHQLLHELEQIGDERAFYRTSEGYLYDLTAFAMTRIKEPYLRELVRAVPRGARLLDWGCGIGSDGLALAEAGYEVTFVDFDNPSTRYLRWRLERRGIAAPVLDVEADEVGPGFDLAYAFDVIEHVDDPWRLLRELESRARLVLVNFLEPDAGYDPLHRRLPIGDLVRHAAGHGLRRYRVVGGRSHLVLYEPARPRGLRARVALARGRIGRLGGLIRR